MFNGIGTSFQDIATGYSNTSAILARGGELNALGTAAKIGAHAVAGGVMSVLQGGKFGHGFISAGVVEAIDPKALSMAGDNKVAQIIGAAVIGGTASRLAGGKFSNGAVTGAFSWAFNQLSHHTPLIDSSLSGVGYVAGEYNKWPVDSSEVTGRFGLRDLNENDQIDMADSHWSTDFQAPLGSSIYSIQSGTVTRITIGTPGLQGTFGEVRIRNVDGTLSQYGHVAAYGGLRVGDAVSAGQTIALSDRSGTTDAHLHYSYWERRNNINPAGNYGPPALAAPAANDWRVDAIETQLSGVTR